LSKGFSAFVTGMEPQAAFPVDHKHHRATQLTRFGASIDKKERGTSEAFA